LAGFHTAEGGILVKNCIAAQLSVCIGLMSVLPTVTIAQDTAPPTRAGDQLEQVIVTARRTEERVQEVPLTISAFNAETLREASIKETQDLMYSVPGLYLAGGGGEENAVYTIRGQSRPVAGPGQPGVVTYFAEVPQPNFGSQALLYDMSSAQVLKGPQGTLFGRNTTGGAVLLYPTAPSDTFDAYVQGTYGNYDYQDVEGAVNIPLVSDKAALRMSGRLSRRDGYTNNVGAGSDPDDIHSDQGRIALRLTPFEALENITYFDYRRTKQTGSAQLLVEVTPLAAVFGLDALLNADFAAQQARGPRTVDYGPFDPRSHQKHITVVNRTTLQLGPVEVVNIFGYQELEWLYDANTDALPEPVGLLDAINIYHPRLRTEELQLRGTALNETIDWIVGGFLFKSDAYDTNGSIFPQFFGVFPGNFTYNYTDEESRAVFANVKSKLDGVLEGLSVNLGMRYTWDEQDGCGGNGESNPPFTIGPNDCRADHPVFVTDTGAELHYESSAPTWTFGLDWKVTDELFAYFTTRRGYRAGGLNFPALGTALRSQQTFDPEKITDFEVGMKSSWHAGSVSGLFNIAAFLAKAKDVQYALTGAITQPGCIAGDPVFGSAPFSPDGDCNTGNDPAQTVLLVNIGDTEVRGIELEASISPLEGLRFGATATLLDQATDKLSIAPNLQAFSPIRGNKIPLEYTAEQSYTLDARYRLPLSSTLGDLSLYAAMYHSGKVNMLAYRADAYTLVDVRADWNGIMGSRLDLGLFGKNVFDEEAVMGGAINTPGTPGISVIFNEPRTYGVQLRYRFAD
jgi:iron complex outermembrane recepter protein